MWADKHYWRFIDLEARLGLAFLSLDAVKEIYVRFDHTRLENNIQKVDLGWLLASRSETTGG